jgi:Na+/H+-dicarboxylate symporter
MHVSVNRSVFLKKYGIFIAVILGVAIGLYGPNWSMKIAESVSTVFMRLLKFVSLPIISFL